MRILKAIIRFFTDPFRRRTLYVLLLAVFALGEWLSSGASRQTFVFIAAGGEEIVEERMIRRPQARERASSNESTLAAIEENALQEAGLRRYVEEVLLGPVSPELTPLFPRETALYSLLLREGAVYIDLSLAAASAAVEGGDCFRALYTLNRGVRRNFRFVRDVRLFIEGQEAYSERFNDIFSGNSGKKAKSA
jgi:hypothetical protein